ncbi:MAG: acylphosphatase [Georgfuchsia sp.]
MEARRLVITGLVQGVGFRYHMVNAALRLGIAGWVRNRRDGSVEAVISGDAETIAAMIHWTRSGPPAARVDQVYVEHLDTDSSLAGFSQQPTE